MLNIPAITEKFIHATTNFDGWHACMEMISSECGAYGAVLLPIRGRLPRLPVSRSMLPSLETYISDEWYTRDIRYQGVGTMMRRGIITDFDFTSEGEIRRHPYYQDFLARHGLRWFAGLKVDAGDDAWCLSIQRQIPQDAFSLSAQNDLVHLGKHLSSAATCAQALSFSALEGVSTAFEICANAAILFNRYGEVVTANERAERLLGEDLQIVGRRLVSFDHTVTAEIDRVLHTLIWSADGPHAMPPLTVKRRQGRPLIAYPAKIAGSVRDVFSICHAVFVLVDLEERVEPHVEDLALIFSLTPSEARMASMMAAGKGLPEVALAMNVTEETARKRLKAIFHKTGMNKQGALVALLSQFRKVQRRSFRKQ